MYIQYSIYVACVCCVSLYCIGLALRISYCCKGNVMPKRGHHGKKIFEQENARVTQFVSFQAKQILQHNTTQHNTTPPSQCKTYPTVISYQSCMLIDCLLT